MNWQEAVREWDDRVQGLADEQVREIVRFEVDNALRLLPMAGTTHTCPKCLFGMLTYRYTSRSYSARSRCWFIADPELARRGYGIRGLRSCTRKVIVRTCPQCTAEVLERPADEE